MPLRSLAPRFVGQASVSQPGVLRGRRFGAIASARAAAACVQELEARLLLSGYALGALASFQGANGAMPESGLVMDASGNFYGVTSSGGASGDGAVFEVMHGSNAVALIASFNGTNGSDPGSGGLSIDATGDLFGTTTAGGASGDGTVFEVVAGSSSITTLATFDGTNGANPQGQLTVDGAGNAFGATMAGGSLGDGTVFEVAAGSGAVTTLASFTGSTGGAAPSGPIVMDSSGDLFGTTESGGSSNAGTVYEVVAASGAVTTVASFTGANGSNPTGLIEDASGNLYGTTAGGGAGSDGTVFEVPAGSGAISTLASFSGTNGASPLAAPIVDSSGDLFGTTYGGGASSFGTVWEIPVGAGAITDLASLTQATGALSAGSLVADGSGDFFGVAAQGGANGDGTVFEVSPGVAGPTAAISAPGIASPGATSEQITVTYTDSLGLDPASIAASNLTVTGPGQTPLTVSSVTATPSSGTPTTLTAVYTVAPPDGTFTGADDGSYSVTVNAGQVTDVQGNAAPMTPGDFTVSIVPIDSISAPAVTTAGGHAENVTITYTDAAGINLATIAASNITVIGPSGAPVDGARLAVSGISYTPPLGSPTTVTAVYTVVSPYDAAAPEGGWSNADNGTYTIQLAAGAVFDSSGHYGNNADSASFTVNVPTSPPTASFSPPSAVTSAGAASEQVTVTYTAGAGINLSTINVNNLTVQSPFGTALNVTGVTTNAPAALPGAGAPTPPSVTATYTIAAPAGGFSVADNGAYTVTLNGGLIADTLGNTAPAKSTSFAVDLAPVGSDPAFGAGGNVALSFAAQSSAVLSNGQIIVVGYQSTASGQLEGVIERLNANGSLDTTFGSGGMAIDSATADESFYGVSIQSDGKILVSGSSNGSLLIARYNANGSPDATFGANGRVATAIGSGGSATVYSLALDPRNQDVVVGGGSSGQFLIDRFTATGAVDPTFNAGAPLTFSAGTPNTDVLGQIAVETDGDIIGAGAAGADVAVVRVTPGGQLDASFGTGGIVTVSDLATLASSLGQRDHTEGLALDGASGAILVGNSTFDGHFGIVRLTAAGALDPTWGNAGLVETSFGGQDDVDALAVQSDGSEIFAAGTTTANGATLTAIAAYTASGLPDTTLGVGGKESFQSGLPATAGSVGTGYERASGDSAAPLATGDGAVFSSVFASLSGGQFVVGANQQGSNPATKTTKGEVRRLNVPVPLPSGTLSMTVAGKLPPLIVGGARERASAQLLVRNSTGSAINGNVGITLYVGPTPSLSGATQLMSTKRAMRLRPGAAKSVRLSIASFPSLAKGTYYLMATVTAPNGSVTGAAATKTLTIEPPIVKAVVSKLAPVTAAVAPGKTATVSFQIQNTGNEPINRTASVALAASAHATGAGGTALATIGLKVNLKASASKTFRLKLKIPATLAAGSYYLTIALTGLGDSIPADGVAVSAATIRVT